MKMLPFGLSDLIALLDRWSVWKDMRATLAKVPALEERIAALEERLQRAPGEACPKCGELAFRSKKSAAMPGKLGRTGHRQVWMECTACGYADKRTIAPAQA
jgi:hypothetical protein